MKVKCIKDTIGYESWQIYETVWNFIKSNIDTHVFWSRFPEYFQEVVDKSLETKPRWKVGDYVVREYKEFSPDYCIVYKLSDWYINGEDEKSFRRPTNDEAEMFYFQPK